MSIAVPGLMGAIMVISRDGYLFCARAGRERPTSVTKQTAKILSYSHISPCKPQTFPARSNYGDGPDW